MRKTLALCGLRVANILPDESILPSVLLSQQSNRLNDSESVMPSSLRYKASSSGDTVF